MLLASFNSRPPDWWDIVSMVGVIGAGVVAFLVVVIAVAMASLRLERRVRDDAR